MTSKFLRGTDLQVSPLGLGTVELGLPYGIDGATPPAEEEAIRLLHWAHDQGVRFFDTAAGYGRSEELLGRAFGGRPDRPVIATKVGIADAATGEFLTGKTLKKGLTESLQRSIRALRGETLDLVQIHAPAEGLFLSDELLEAMDGAVGAGLVRHWGVSTYGLEQPADALRHPGTIRTVQIAANILDRGPIRTIFPACAAAGVGVIVRSVFLKGALSERLEALPEHLGPLKEAGAGAREIAATHGLTLPELALRYCASLEHVQVVLVGTARLQELSANLKAFAAGPLPGPVLAQIESIEIEDQRLLNPGNWGIQ